MVEVLRDIIARNRAGGAVAIPSVCSAHPDVLEASLRLARRLGRPVVVEATSNQVNQEGGYTGMRPADFIAYLHGIADGIGADRDAILFGGDHLGTQVWRKGAADQAMDKARRLVADYVAAGFTKIHLDCSEGCAGEPAQLDDALTAERSADLARVCLDVAPDLMFVIGTEVPPPGGARVDEDGDIPATTPQAARATLDAHDAAFGEMKQLIGGLVVQPGVEFSPTAVHHLPMARDPALKEAIAHRPTVCLEAHSTDYQHDTAYPRLAELGFAFQKVGPALTFAYRKALYALDQLRKTKGALADAVEAAMLANPVYWQGHYGGDAEAVKQQRHFGLADRVRYYWPVASVQAAVTDLLAEIDDRIAEKDLITAFDKEVLDRAEDIPGAIAKRLIHAQIECALAPYFFEETT